MALAGIIAYFINYSTEQTNKVSFKAAGVKYKQHFKVSELSSLPDLPADKKQKPEQKKQKILKNVFQAETEEVQEILKNFFQALDDGNSTNSSFTKEVKQSQSEENLEVGLDLQVFSSFDCVKSIPTVLLDYTSTMFRNEYGKSHKDFHSEYEIEETIPLLEKFNINCDIDQNCSALFQFDKHYGLRTSADKTFKRNELFYCCPSVHSLTNVTITNACKSAQTAARKSIFRESKDSTFLGGVILVVPEPF